MQKLLSVLFILLFAGISASQDLTIDQTFKVLKTRFWGLTQKQCGTTQSFYDGTPAPIVLPTQADLEEMELSTNTIPDNRQANDIKINVVSGALTIRNNIIPAIKGPGINGVHLGVSYTYNSSIAFGNLGWHNSLSFELQEIGCGMFCKEYSVGLPDGNSYRFEGILKGQGNVTWYRPAGTSEDANFSSLTSYDSDEGHTFCLTTRNGTRYFFRKELGGGLISNTRKIVEIRDRAGNAIKYKYIENALEIGKCYVSELQECAFDRGGEGAKFTGRKIQISYTKQIYSSTNHNYTVIYKDPLNRITTVENKLSYNGNGSVTFLYPDGTSASYFLNEYLVSRIQTPSGDSISFTYVEDPYAGDFDVPENDFCFGSQARKHLYHIDEVSDAMGTAKYSRALEPNYNAPGNNKIPRIREATVIAMNGVTYKYEVNFNGQATKREILPKPVVGYADTVASTEIFEWYNECPDGGLLGKYTDMNGVMNYFEYTQGNSTRHVISPIAHPDSQTVYQYTYNDDFDIIEKLIDPNGKIWKNDINPQNGLIRKRTNPDSTFREYVYNTANQLTESRNENGNATKYRYNQWGLIDQITDAQNNTTTFVYDAASNLIKKTDANGHITEYQYDAMNRTIKTVYKGVDNLPDAVVLMKYDPNGNMCEKIDEEGKISKYTYNMRNQLVIEEDHLLNKITSVYDSTGNKIAETDKRGKTTTNKYDFLNRLVESTSPLINSVHYSTYYTYSGYCGNPLAAGGKALPTTIIDKNGNTTRALHDYNGRTIKETDAEGNSTDYRYDKNGNVIDITDALGRKTTHSYSSTNRLLEKKFSLDIFTEYIEKFHYDSAGNLTAQTDRNNHTTSTDFDKVNRPVRITNHLGDSIAFAYDAVGNKVQEKDGNGNITRFAYDHRNRLEKATDALMGTTLFTYNKAGDTLSKTDPNGNTTQFSYDDLHRLKTTKCAEGYIIDSLAYDENGNVLLKKDGEGNVTTYSYDELNRLAKETFPTSGHGAVEKQYTYDKLSNIIGITDENGHTTTNTYNKVNKLLRTTNPLSHYTENEYDKVYNVIKVRDLRGNVTETIYDALNRPKEIKRPDNTTSSTTYDPVGNVLTTTDFKGYVTTFEYDATNRKIKETDPYFYFTTITYDKNSNVISQTDKRGNTFTTVYDSLNRKKSEIDPYNNATTYIYEPNGNVKSITDENGLTTSFAYDKLNRKTRQIDHRNQAQKFGYDKVGNSTHTLDRNGVITAKEYDSRNRLITVREDSGGINVITRYDYDKVGNRTEIKDANNNITRFQYDDANRLTKHTFPDATYYSFQYDNATNILDKRTSNGNHIFMTYDKLNRLKTKNLGPQGVWSFYYDNNGNMIEAVNPQATLSYTYDKLNRVLTETADYALASGPKIMNYAYDPDGNVTNSTSPAGKTIGYGYDKRNLLTGVASHNGITAEFGYDDGGRLTSEELSNGVITGFAYDNLNRLLEMKSSALTIQQNFDKETNKLFERVAYGAVSKADHFDYDNLYRVIGTKYDVVSQLTSGTISQSNQPVAPAFSAAISPKEQATEYDKLHNRIAHTTSGVTSSYAANERNQYTAVDGVAYTYDDNGNLLGDGSRLCEFDWENRLLTLKRAATGTTIAQYQYGPDGRRIAKVVASGATRLYYYDVAWNLSAEYDGASNLVREFTYAGAVDKPITATVNLANAGINPVDIGLDAAMTNVKFCYHQNSIGDVLALTDSIGNVVLRYSYDVHGQVTLKDKDGNGLNGSAADAFKKLNEFYYTGRQGDEESGFYYYRNRYYAPGLGRFISADPLDYVDGMNVYAYVNGNVVNLVDPMGLSGYFVDGTGNDENSGSNIIKMHDAYKKCTETSKYYAGPGSDKYSGMTKAFGLAFGYKSRAITNTVYKDIVENWKNGDQKIDLFGFSRGAAIANEVAWLVSNKGIVDANGKVLAKPGEAEVRFLGLFDMVHSMGAPDGSTTGGYHRDKMAPNVKFAAHVISIDETRTYFNPSYASTESNETILHEQGFPGKHSDVGGHKENNQEIMKITRDWMAREAQKAGINEFQSQDKQIFLTNEEKIKVLTEQNMTPSATSFPSADIINPLKVLLPLSKEDWRMQKKRKFSSDLILQGILVK